MTVVALEMKGGDDNDDDDVGNDVYDGEGSNNRDGTDDGDDGVDY